MKRRRQEDVERDMPIVRISFLPVREPADDGIVRDDHPALPVMHKLAANPVCVPLTPPARDGRLGKDRGELGPVYEAGLYDDRDAYVGLVREYRRVAALLRETSEEMEACRTLPMAPHDPEKLTHEWHAAHADACTCRPIALLGHRALPTELPRREPSF